MNWLTLSNLPRIDNMFSLALLSTFIAVVLAQDDCEPINWHDCYTEIGLGNSIINFAENSTLVEHAREHFNGIVLSVNRQTPLEKKILGTTYIMETIVSRVNVTGLKHVKLRPVKVLDHNVLEFRASSDDNLLLDTTITTQYKKKMESLFGFKYCPYEWIFWEECPTRTATVDSNMVIKGMKIKSGVKLEVYRCSRRQGFWSQVACRFNSAVSFMTSLFDNDNMVNNGFMAEMLKRMKSARVLTTKVSIRSTTIQTKVRVDSDKDDIEEDIELHIKQDLTKGAMRNLIFDGVAFATQQAANAAIEVVEPLFQARCSRR